MYTYVYSLDIFIVCHLFLHSKRYEVIDVFAKERRTNMIIALKYSFYLPLCLSSKRASSKGREIPRDAQRDASKLAAQREKRSLMRR